MKQNVLGNGLWILCLVILSWGMVWSEPADIGIPQEKEYQEPTPDTIRPFFAFCIDTHDEIKRTLTEQAAMLKELGYAGAGHLELPHVEERALTLLEQGLRLFQVYVTVDMAKGEPVDKARISQVLPWLKPHKTHLALMIQGGESSDPALDGRVVALTKELDDMCRPYDVKVVLYPHTRFWLETSRDAVRIAKKVDRLGSVGVMFNLSHWMKSDPNRDLGAVLREAEPWLLAVSLNGTDTPDQIYSGQGDWLQPLDQGANDIRDFLHILGETDFNGPVGLQCWGIRGDARKHLERSLGVWKRIEKIGLAGSLPAPAIKTNEVLRHRLKTFGTMGKAVYPLEAGREAVLFQHSGKGCLTHMWFGGNWKDYGRLKIRVSVDDEDVPSIDMELHLGHGIGFQDDAAPWGTKRIGKTGSPSGVYNTYRIPFGSQIRVTAQLPEGDTGNPRFWYIIRGIEGLPVEFSGVRLPDNARLRLYKREDFTVQTLEEFNLCDTTTAGMLYQVTIAAQSEDFNFLESCVRAYLDGEEKPLMLSSGLEDYFLGTYFFNRGPYANEVAGLTHKDSSDHSFSAYRFHEEDLLFFEKGLRLTCRCGEQTEGETWKAPPTTYTTYVWIYEW